MSACRLTPCIWGMGDDIWLLPILKALHREYDTLYVETPWPQMYEGFEWIRCLNPSSSDSPYASWPMFRESIEASLAGFWDDRAPDEAEEIRLCETGDYSTRLNSFYHFEGDADLYFPLKPKWRRVATEWLMDNVGPKDPQDFREWNDTARKPKVLLHVPMYPCGKTTDDPAFARYCDPELFVNLYRIWEAMPSQRVRFFDCQRVVEGENYPAVELPMPLYHGDGATAPILWALTQLADAIVTTDNHMLPLALAFHKPTLYLAGSVPISYLFDSRIDARNVEIVPHPARDLGEAFERVLARVGK